MAESGEGKLLIRLYTIKACISKFTLENMGDLFLVVVKGKGVLLGLVFLPSILQRRSLTTDSDYLGFELQSCKCAME